MDKLKYIKLEKEDGSYSDNIPLAVDANYVDINGNTLLNVLNEKASASSLATLTTRVDNLTKLDEGSTTGDAELIDIRTGYDGTAYTNAGEAVRTQVSSLNNNLNSLNLDITTKVVWAIENKYLRYNLSLTAANGNGYAVSAPIDLGPRETITIYGYSWTNFLSMITLADDEGSYKQCLVQGTAPTGLKNYTYTNETNEYQRIVLSSGRLSDVKVWKTYNLDNYKNEEIILPDFNTFVAKNGEKEVTAKNAEFLDVVYKNMFDGNYISNIVISGDTSFQLLVNNERYHLAKVKIKPNTSYTISMRGDGESSWHAKVCTTTTDKITGNVDGAVKTARAASVNNKYFSVTTGPNDQYLFAQGPAYNSEDGEAFIQIKEGTSTEFITDKYNDYYAVPNELLEVSKEYPEIIIVPNSSTSFSVQILDKTSKKYLTHTFIRVVYTDELSYGEGDSKVVTTCDVWYPQYVKDFDNHSILQGNASYIHSLAVPGHTGHVGAGHGCCVAIWTKFFADGVIFDPTTLTEPIYCSTFRFTEQVKHFLRVGGAGTSAHSIPSVDENGDPIVTCIETFDGDWTVNNRIKFRNRLQVVYDGLKFIQCHAAMLCGFYPYFNNILVNNKESTWNQVTKENDEWIRSNPIEGGRVFENYAYVIGDQATLWGDKYRVTQRTINYDPSYYGKMNLLLWLPPSDNDRLKVYYMPVVTTSSSENISEGQEVTILNSGDILDTTTFREIDVIDQSLVPNNSEEEEELSI